MGIAEDINDENNRLLIKEKNSFYSFLLQRTSIKYDLKKSACRRNWISNEHSKTTYPMLTDEMLESLYIKAQKKYSKQSAFNMTPAEMRFLKALRFVLNKNPNKYRNIDVFPYNDVDDTSQLTLQKIVIGMRVPDFTIVGIRSGLDSMGVIFEINGPIHEFKTEKDLAFSKLAKKLGFLVIPIENERAGDVAYVEAILNSLTPCNTLASKRQTGRLIKRLWTLTVCCHFTLSEIEDHVLKEFKVKLNLENELAYLLKSLDCPRVIKAEARLCGFDSEKYFTANTTKRILA